ncbi:MAG: IclR family transcriptional regulator [Zhaonellaceae bacterium]|jgi:IclR family KDG regulon transcriptional repressor
MENRNIKSLENAINLLLSLSKKEYISVTELSNDLGLTKGAVSKILATFRNFDFVTQDDQTKQYSLGPMLISLGYYAMNRLDIRKIAKPFLAKLSEKYNENTMIMMAQGEQVIVVELCESNLPIKLAMKLGECHPFYRGAAPKVLLAYMDEKKRDKIIDKMQFEPLTKNTITQKERLLQRLEEIKRDGYCISKGEIDLSIMAIAVPIRDFSGNVVASLAMSGPRGRMEEHNLENILQDLFKIADLISVQLGAKA